MKDNYTEEQSIDILDMLKRLLKKWKLILLAGVVCAVAAGMLFAYKAYANRENTVQLAAERPYYSYSAANAAKNLSEEEKTAAEDALIQYSSYSDEKNLITEHLDNSIYLNLGSGAVPAVAVSYIIDTEDGEAAVNDIRSAYILKLSSDDVIKSIISECGLETEPEYFAELVRFNLNSENQLTVKKSADEDITISLPSYNQASNLLSIVVCGPSREFCESAAGQYSSAVKSLTPQIEEELGSLEFELLPAGETYLVLDGGRIARERSEQCDRITELGKNIKTLESGLDDGVEALYQQLKADQSIIDSGSETQITEMYTPTDSIVNKKAIAIGFIAGVFVMCAYLCLKYIMGNCIRVKSDIGEMFGLTDCVSEENINSIISRKEYKKVAVLGTAKDMLSIGNSDISEADAAVLAEKIDVSRTADIRHEIDICRQHDVPIIGYIVFN